MNLEIRVGAAGNGTPVFMATGSHPALGRPFGAVFDSGRRLWMYPAFYPASKKVLADLDVMSKDFHITFSDVARRHVQGLKHVEESVANRALPVGFEYVTQPYDHQILGLCHAWWMLRAAMFYDPGLGKSKIAIDLIRLMRHVGQRGTVLILGPLVTVTNWGREIDRHSGGQLRWVILHGPPKERLDILTSIEATPPDVVLLTYDVARVMSVDLVRRVPYEAVICDESHLVKSWDSGRTISTYDIAQKASRRVLMTGSPTQGDPRDTYGQYKILGDCFMPEDYSQFKRKFLVTPSPRSHAVTGFKNLDVLNSRVTFLSLRKTKEECLDLPEQVVVDVPYSLSRTQKVLHNQLVEQMEVDPDVLAILMFGRQATLPPASRMPHRAAMLLKLLQIASGFLITNPIDDAFCDQAEPGGCRHLEACVEARVRPHTPRCLVDSSRLPDVLTVFDENPKLDATEELLETILVNPTNKTIIWCSFENELNIVSAMLDRRGWGHVRVDGSNSREAQGLIDQFTVDDGIRVYLAQVSTGVGVTINAASYMIYYALPFSLIVYEQSKDRNYRIGQTRKVTVYRMQGQGTPEPAIARLLDVKIDVDDALTRRTDCMCCEYNPTCIPAGVHPFDVGCSVYKRTIDRPVTRARPFEGTDVPDTEES